MKRTKIKVSVLLLSAALISSALSLGMLSTTASADTSYPLMDSPPDTPAQVEKDRLNEPFPRPTPLPAAVDKTAAFPAPGQQGNQGSCTAWAVAYAYKTMQENVDHGWGVDTPLTQFSPSFVYNQINPGRDKGKDKGSSISDAMRLLKNTGAATLADMPYKAGDLMTQPTAAQLANADQYRSESFGSVKGTTALKKSIVNTGGAVIAIPVYIDFKTISSSNKIYDVMSGKFLGWHAIALIGYDDAKKAFKFINSWGTGYGLNGYGWIAYSLVDNPNAFIYGYTMTDRPEPNNTNSAKMTGRVVSGDFNGDGRSDMAALYDAGNSKTILYVWYANANGTFIKQQQWITTGYTAAGLTGRVVAGDFNGDGKADIAGFYDYGNSQTRIHVWLSTGGGFTYAGVGDNGWWKTTGYTAAGLTGRVVAGDFNGDGKADIAGFYDYGTAQYGVSQTRIHVWLSTGRGFNYAGVGDNGWWKTTSYAASMLTGRVVAGDFNGDGKADIAGFYDYGNSQTRIHVWLSTGSGFNYSGTGDNGWWKTTGYTATQLTGRIVAGDFNGDKKTDIAGFYDYGNSQTRIHVWLSTGGGFNYSGAGDNGWWKTTGYTATQLTGRLVAGDFNGDKKTDIAGFYDYGNAQTRAHVWLSTGTGLNYQTDNGWWRT